VECSAFVKKAGCLDDTVVVLDDLFADGKAYAGAFVDLLVVKPLKHFEDLPVKMRLKANAIVCKNDVAIFILYVCHFLRQVLGFGDFTADPDLRIAQRT
jgi:hypothetical protein